MATQKNSADRKALLDRRRQEDARFTYRVLITFGLAAALLFSVIRLSGWIGTVTASDAQPLMKTLIFLFSGVTLLGVVLALVFRLALTKRVIASVFGYVTAASAVTLLSILFLWRFPADGLWPLCVIILGIALLYLLFYIYPREFSVLALLISSGAMGFWFIRRRLQTVLYGTIAPGRTWPARATLPVLAFVGAIVIAALILLLLRAKKGKLGPVRILPNQTRYTALLATCGLFLLGLICSVIFGWIAAYAFMIGCFVYLFIAAIYYTSKLM